MSVSGSELMDAAAAGAMRKQVRASARGSGSWRFGLVWSCVSRCCARLMCWRMCARRPVRP